jgi:hypothetical protein
MNTNEQEVFLNDDRYEALVAEIIKRLTPSRDAVVEALADFGVIPERVREKAHPAFVDPNEGGNDPASLLN